LVAADLAVAAVVAASAVASVVVLVAVAPREVGNYAQSLPA